MGNNVHWFNKAVLFINLMIIILGLILDVLFARYPSLVEEIYFNKIFIPLRRLTTVISEYLPISTFYIWLILLLSLIVLIRHYARQKRCSNWVIGFQLVIILAAHISLFYILWGFNYQRTSILDRLKLGTSITKEEFFEELQITLEQLNHVSKQVKENTILDWKELNTILCYELSIFLESNQLTSFCPVYSKPLYPNGSLLVWSTAGIYWPFAGESMVDPGLHTFEIPYTMAHELAHGMGWTDEGECNWLAYESCIRSQNVSIRYSALISYWKYLIYQTTAADSNRVIDLYSKLDTLVFKDLKSIRTQHNQYPDFFPKFRNAFYNWYLKKNKVKSGIRSYDDITRLVINYKKLRSS